MSVEVSPSGWTEGTVGGHCALLNGLAFKPSDWTDFGQPIIRIQNLNGSTDFNRYDRWVGPAYIIEPGTLVFSWSGNRGTSFGPYRWPGPSGILNQHIFKVLPRDGTDPDWFFYALDAVRRRAEQAAHGGSGLVHVRRGDLLEYSVPTPPLPEQRRIAEILDTANEAIRCTQKVIAKLEHMKLGLVTDLLARGIDEHGELRDPEPAPTEFWGGYADGVPNSWAVMRLQEACGLIRDGTHLPPQRVEVGPRLLSVRNMEDGRLVLRDDDTRVPWSFYRRMHSNWTIESGDVLLAIVGATLGKSARVGTLPPFTLQRSVAVLRGRDGTLTNDFLTLIVQCRVFQNRLWQLANQTAQPGLYLKQLGEIEVPVPHIEEQGLIAERVGALEARIISEQAILKKLQLSKQGLMDDLLTGRVRVPIPEEASA